ncbi:autoinducer binding domain-containing protein [Methylocaldum gracile]|jgi:LuxR family quorum-sensing system transcriptional regulator SolR
MKTWQEDQLHALLSVQCEQKLFEVLASFARELGFDYCAYGLRMPFPFSQPKTMMFNNYPFEWQTRYREKNYLGVDPTVRHGLRSHLPITWSENLFAAANELWDDARSFGLRFGWAQSSRDANGVMGMLTLARSCEPLSEVELQNKELKMVWLTQIAHLGMSRCLTPKLIPAVGARLSERELEVLRWTAEGKTSGEISYILNISERTVNFHVSNAMAKLNAANKTAAVILAAVFGLLY